MLPSQEKIDVTEQAMQFVFAVNHWLLTRHQWLLQSMHRFNSADLLLTMDGLPKFEDLLPNDLLLPQVLQKDFELRQQQLEALWGEVKQTLQTSAHLGSFLKRSAFRFETERFLHGATVIVRQLWQERFLRDELTAAWTRPMLQPSLRYLLQDMEHHPYPGTLLMLNQNEFRLINHCWGHATGDAVLIRLAQIIHQELRPYDQLFRHHADIWLILMPATTQPLAEEITDRILQRIHAHPFVAPDQHIFKVTMSIGLAQAGQNENPTHWLARAEVALTADSNPLARQNTFNTVR